MPGVIRRTTNAKLDWLADNGLIRHLADTDDIILTDLSAFTEADGSPTFAFQKQCHDKYQNLARRHSYMEANADLITRYDVFAIAVLRARAKVRRRFAQYIYESDIEHPDVKQLIDLARHGRGTPLSRAVDNINRRRGNPN